MKLDLTGVKVRKEFVLLAILVGTWLVWFYREPLGLVSGRGSAAAPSVQTVAAATPSSPAARVVETGGAVSRLRLELLRKHDATEDSASRRNPFIFPRPKPTPAELIQDAAPPPKPRPTADYQGYLTSDGKRYALIKMNNEAQVVQEGGGLPSGYTLVSVSPVQIVLKDSDGETYKFALPR
ncbi:MAG: hypothetical protein AB1714_29245 [Acidobacteriota bacterium]